MSLVDECLARIQKLPPEQRKNIEEARAKDKSRWLPTVGPQLQAARSPADILLFGGQGGGGKSDLGLGLAFMQHKRSLILRRQYSNLSALTERALEINGSKSGFNGSPPPLLRTEDGRYIQFGANQYAGDEQAWQGHAFDYKFFDEAVQFLESQIRFHLGWLRSTDPKQRVRAVLGSNPPIDAAGDFIIKMFRPWLDLTYPKPAKPGELRWYVTAPDGSDLELPDSTPVELEGRKLEPMSRTFIPSALSDNPYLVRTNYQSKLDGLPEPLRSAVRDGNFMASRQDAAGQVIPLDWIIAAQSRWKPEGYKDFAMTAMGFDPAGGGRDSAELCWRHGGWYAPLISAQGEETAQATESMAAVFLHRKDNAPVVIDVGGGYAGPMTTRMTDNGIFFVRFNGSNKTTARTKDGNLCFVNKRAEAWWKFREELDPGQYGGSAIALPPDPELRADLATPCLNLRALETKGEIQIESKDDIKKRLGRSPGKGDSVVMALSIGEAAVRRMLARSGASNLPKYAKTSSGPLSRRRSRA